MYLQVLDEERYGLFTLYFIIIIYFRILDFGFTATFNRYVALKKNSKEGIYFIRQLLKNYEIIFLILSLFVIVLTLFSNNYFAKNWIISDKLSIYSIAYSLIIISLIITFRFFITLYRAGINGYEKQVWLNIFRVFFEFINIFGGLVFCYVLNYFITFKIYYLFWYFLIFNIFEFLVLRIKILHLISFSIKLNNISFQPFKETFSLMFLIGVTGFYGFL